MTRRKYSNAGLWRELRRALASYALLWAVRLTPKGDERTRRALAEAGQAMRDTDETGGAEMVTVPTFPTVAQQLAGIEAIDNAGVTGIRVVDVYRDMIAAAKPDGDAA